MLHIRSLWLMDFITGSLSLLILSVSFKPRELHYVKKKTRERKRRFQSEALFCSVFLVGETSGRLNPCLSKKRSPNLTDVLRGWSERPTLVGWVPFPFLPSMWHRVWQPGESESQSQNPKSFWSPEKGLWNVSLLFFTEVTVTLKKSSETGVSSRKLTPSPFYSGLLLFKTQAVHLSLGKQSVLLTGKHCFPGHWPVISLALHLT